MNSTQYKKQLFYYTLLEFSKFYRKIKSYHFYLDFYILETQIPQSAI